MKHSTIISNKLSKIYIKWGKKVGVFIDEWEQSFTVHDRFLFLSWAYDVSQQALCVLHSMWEQMCLNTLGAAQCRLYMILSCSFFSCWLHYLTSQAQLLLYIFFTF